MKIITSRTNQTVKDICALHAKKGRVVQSCFVAEGLRTIKTLLSSNIQLKQLYLTQDVSAESLPQDHITYVSPEVMQKISTTKTPSGYLGVYEIPPKPQQALQHGLVLAQVADPGNVGALIRSAAAFAAQAVVVVDSADPWSPKAICASMGTIGMVSIYQYSWQELLAAKKNIKLLALNAKATAPLEKCKASNALLVVGNEARGIPQEWLPDCDEQILIIMPGKAESLNAAVAGSIALYAMQKSN